MEQLKKAKLDQKDVLTDFEVVTFLKKTYDIDYSTATSMLKTMKAGAINGKGEYETTIGGNLKLKELLKFLNLNRIGQSPKESPGQNTLESFTQVREIRHEQKIQRQVQNILRESPNRKVEQDIENNILAGVKRRQQQKQQPVDFVSSPSSLRNALNLQLSQEGRRMEEQRQQQCYVKSNIKERLNEQSEEKKQKNVQVKMTKNQNYILRDQRTQELSNLPTTPKGSIMNSNSRNQKQQNNVRFQTQQIDNLKQQQQPSKYLYQDIKLGQYEGSQESAAPTIKIVENDYAVNTRREGYKSVVQSQNLKSRSSSFIRGSPKKYLEKKLNNQQQDNSLVVIDNENKASFHQVNRDDLLQELDQMKKKFKELNSEFDQKYLELFSLETQQTQQFENNVVQPKQNELNKSSHSEFLIRQMRQDLNMLSPSSPKSNFYSTQGSNQDGTLAQSNLFSGISPLMNRTPRNFEQNRTYQVNNEIELKVKTFLYRKPSLKQSQEVTNDDFEELRQSQESPDFVKKSQDQVRVNKYKTFDNQSKTQEQNAREDDPNAILKELKEGMQRQMIKNSTKEYSNKYAEKVSPRSRKALINDFNETASHDIVSIEKHKIRQLDLENERKTAYLQRFELLNE